jgi:hypothetical protein
LTNQYIENFSTYLDVRQYLHYCSLGIRVIYIRDGLQENRGNYIKLLFSNVSSFRLVEHDARLLASIDGGYQTLIVHGEDNARLCSFMRSNAKFLKGKAKLCMKTRIWPSDAAQLLNAGFDDVLDLKMHRDEAAARFLAIHHRRLSHLEEAAARGNASLQEEIKKYVSQSLTSREAMVLAKLVTKRGNIVSYGDLARPFQRKQAPLGRKSLVVFISKLRRKLNEDSRIISSSGEGYCFKAPGVV